MTINNRPVNDQHADLDPSIEDYEQSLLIAHSRLFGDALAVNHLSQMLIDRGESKYEELRDWTEYLMSSVTYQDRAAMRAIAERTGREAG